jgi:CheY-like chemotaxis protein
MARAREAGAADYLVRPVTGPELRRAIQALGQPVRHILVVDDEPDVRQLLARMLSADPGLEVTTASNGAQALEELRADPPDLMLLDIIMPGMDGWQVLKRKGEDPAIRDIPVILVSAQDRLDRPVTSKALLATMGDGFSLSKLLQGSLEFSAMLLKPE